MKKIFYLIIYLFFFLLLNNCGVKNNPDFPSDPVIPSVLSQQKSIIHNNYKILQQSFTPTPTETTTPTPATAHPQLSP